MIDISVVIPFKEVEDIGCIELLRKAIESCGEHKVILAIPDDETSAKFSETFGDNVTVVKVINTSNCETPAYLINAGVGVCTTEWFSILQFDDTYKSFWFKEVEKYSRYNPTVGIFMPLTEAVDSDAKRLGYQNEIAWASSFVNNLGELSADVLQDYHLFSPWGSVIKRDTFIKDGGLKPSMKVSYLYEYLMRSANEGHLVYVVPKSGYVHLVNREGGYNYTITKDMDKEEIEWWYDLARKECYFKVDRNKTYEG